MPESLWLIKLQESTFNFVKKRGTSTGVFLYFFEIFKKAFFVEHLWWLLKKSKSKLVSSHWGSSRKIAFFFDKFSWFKLSTFQSCVLFCVFFIELIQTFRCTIVNLLGSFFFHGICLIGFFSISLLFSNFIMQ